MIKVSDERSIKLLAACVLVLLDTTFTMPPCGHCKMLDVLSKPANYITSRAPSFTLISLSLISILFDPRCKVMPDDSKIILFSLASLMVMVPPSSSRRILCFAFVTIVFTDGVASEGISSSRQ